MNKCVAFVATTIWKRFHVPPPQTPCRFYCSPPSHASSNKLFVGGLSWSVDHKSLKEAFSSFGDVTEVRIVYDKDSGRSRGFGFVIFSKEDDAKCAKDAMDGKALLGRPLRINFALEKARGVHVVVPRLSDIGHICGLISFSRKQKKERRGSQKKDKSMDESHDKSFNINSSPPHSNQRFSTGTASINSPTNQNINSHTRGYFQHSEQIGSEFSTVPLTSSDSKTTSSRLPRY